MQHNEKILTIYFLPVALAQVYYLLFPHQVHQPKSVEAKLS